MSFVLYENYGAGVQMSSESSKTYAAATESTTTIIRGNMTEQVSISLTFYARIFCTKVLFLPKHNKRKAARSTFVPKTRL